MFQYSVFLYMSWWHWKRLMVRSRIKRKLVPLKCISYFKPDGQADVRELRQCIADTHSVIFFFLLVCVFSAGLLSEEIFWLCSEENSNFQDTFKSV